VALYIEIWSARIFYTERRLIPLPDPYSLVGSRCVADSNDVANSRSYIHFLIHQRDTEITEFVIFFPFFAADTRRHTQTLAKNMYSPQSHQVTKVANLFFHLHIWLQSKRNELVRQSLWRRSRPIAGLTYNF